ncbi:MAG: L,D-transpeptidase [Actinobacteria bacterium]|nr:L,D-transpeptidase [Actinomycetota bacterium]
MSIYRFRWTVTTAVTVATALALCGSAVAAEAPTGATGQAAAELPSFSLAIGDTYRYRGGRYVLPRAKVEITGKVSAALDGQEVTVRITKHGRTVKSRTVKLDQRGGVSSFSFHYRVGKKGKYIAELALTPEQEAIVKAGSGESVNVVRTGINRGSRGVAVRVFQNKLKSMKYVVPRNGRFDAATGRAFMAFRKNTGMSRNESAGYAVARKLAAGKGRFHLRHPKAGRHVEVDISKQVMAFADKGKVVRIYHVSTGAGGTPTVRGTFHVYRKDPGTNAKGMVKSSYFIRGYAIHGFASVPPYNASHGCVRVPVPNAASIFAWVRMGTRIDTYY